MLEHEDPFGPLNTSERLKTESGPNIWTLSVSNDVADARGSV